jgi:RNA polymerase sigma factor (TIGR02999 family)
MAELTQLIHRARDGDKGASDELFAAVYADLHRLAARQLHGDAGMRTTSLVHEAYVRLARPESLAVGDREHFFAVAARAMRQIAIDHARARVARKRGGGITDLPIEDIDVASTNPRGAVDLLALDDALRRLGELDQALVALVELRFFGGLELSEIAAMNGRSERSLKRDWRKARAFLHVQLGGRAEDPDE